VFLCRTASTLISVSDLETTFQAISTKTFSLGRCDLSHSYLAKFTQESKKINTIEIQDSCNTSRRLEIMHVLVAILARVVLQITLAS